MFLFGNIGRTFPAAMFRFRNKIPFSSPYVKQLSHPLFRIEATLSGMKCQ